MRIAALAAISALLAISAIPTTANAMFQPAPGNTVVCRGANCGGGGGGGTDTNCAAICGTPEIANTAVYRDCSDHLANLPHLTKRDVMDIGRGQRLHLAPVCELNAGHSLTDQQIRYLQRGNVTGLDSAIAANPFLMNELSQHGYKVHDVLGLLVGNNAAVVYVHKM